MIFDYRQQVGACYHQMPVDEETNAFLPTPFAIGLETRYDSYNAVSWEGFAFYCWRTPLYFVGRLLHKIMRIFVFFILTLSYLTFPVRDGIVLR